MLAVVYFPKINLEKIDFIRNKYDSTSTIIAPHITIVSPLSKISEDILIEHVEGIIEKISPFTIRLSGLTKTADHCLFLLVQEGKSEIVSLYNKMYSGILGPFLPTAFSFDPHITLGCFAKDNKITFEKAYIEAQSLSIDVTCNFDAVSIIKGDGKCSAKIIKSIRLRD